MMSLNDNNGLARIESRGLIETLVSIRDALVDQPDQLSLGWVNDHEWVVAPIPDAISDEDAQRLGNMSASIGEEVCFAVSTDEGNEAECYEVRMAPGSIMQFSLELSLRPFLLFPLSVSFAILSEGDHFFLVAGPEDVVVKGIGKPLQAARDSFVKYAIELGRKERTENWLLSVARRYTPDRSE